MLQKFSDISLQHLWPQSVEIFIGQLKSIGTYTVTMGHTNMGVLRMLQHSLGMQRIYFGYRPGDHK